MDVIPPEYDHNTRERVYRQEWLEYFHFIGMDAAMRDHPAEYRALFPRGHRQAPPPSSRVPPPAPISINAPAAPTGPVLPTPPTDAAAPADVEVAKKKSAGSDGGESWSSRTSSSPSTPRDESRAERTPRNDRRDPRAAVDASRREDRHRSSRHRRDSDERRHRHRHRGSDTDDGDDRRHRSRHHSSRTGDERSRHHTSGDSATASRRRRRPEERDDRDERRSSRSHGEDASRRYRREPGGGGGSGSGGNGSSRGRGYDDRREDALRRRDAAHRRYAPEETRGLPMGRVGAAISEEPLRLEEYTQRPSGNDALPLSHFDRLDPLSPRIGENFITFAAFLDCMAARLNVDRHQKRELPIHEDEPHFPYLVAPISFELREMKAFVCNVTLPIKHFMIVHNYNLSSVTEFMDATAAAFAFTDRLQVRRFPRNRGYSGALNVAMRDALTFPFDEVPFFFMSNYDVRFSQGLLERALPIIRKRAFAGKRLLESFKAEVATEPNEHTPPHFRDVPLRSTDDNHLLHTSPSLPDRVRYMSQAEREVVFTDMDGAYYLNKFPQTAVWGLSRLTMETVGFFDENCYPAYYEDTDYLDRMRLIGLGVHYALSERHGVLHIGNNMFKTADANAGATSLGDILAFLRGTALVMRYELNSDYIRAKPLMVNMRTVYDPDAATPRLPPDAWLLNERRRVALMEIVRLCVAHQRADVTATPNPDEERDAELLGFLPEDVRVPVLSNLAAYENAAERYRDGAALRRLRIQL